jgi:cell division protein FtsB
MYYLYIFLALIILYFLYKKYFRKDLTENFDNNLIKINNKNYELDTYAVNNILNELNI